VSLSATIEGVVAKAAKQRVVAKTTCRAIYYQPHRRKLQGLSPQMGVVEATTNDIFKGSGTS
jgi:hypothetical protein